jgi:hypothetical protein
MVSTSKALSAGGAICASRILRNERLSLIDRAREPVEDRPTRGIRLAQTFEDYVRDEIARHELTEADDRLRGGVGAQQVAAGDDRTRPPLVRGTCVSLPGRKRALPRVYTASCSK